MIRGRRTWAVVALSLVAIAAAILFTRSDPDCSPAARMSIAGDATLVSGADGVSVVLTSEDGFTVGALFWILRIGDTEFPVSRYPTFVDTTIEFPLPGAALPRLRDGDTVSIRYGNPATGAGGIGWGAAPIDAAPGTSLATLRIADRCPQ